MGFNLTGALAATDSYFQAGDERKKREREAVLAAQADEQFGWKRDAAAEDAAVRDDRIKATRSGINKTINDNADAEKVRPGATAEALARQGIQAKQTEFDISNLPKKLNRLKAEGVITDEQQAETVRGHLGNYLANKDFFGATKFANTIASDPDLLPITNGQKISSFSPVVQGGKVTGYQMNLEGGESKVLPIQAVESARAKVNASTDKIAADIFQSRAQGNAALANAGANAAQVGIAQQNANLNKQKFDVELPVLKANADDSMAIRLARKGLMDAIDTGDAKKIDAAKQKAIAAGVRFDKVEADGVKFSPSQMGGTGVERLPDGSIAVTPVTGSSVGQRVVIPSSMAASSASKKAPAIGTKGMVNGTPSTWDGKGWVAI